MINTFKKKQIETLKTRAREMHKLGISLRDIGVKVGRSHTWVQNAINEKPFCTCSAPELERAGFPNTAHHPNCALAGDNQKKNTRFLSKP